MTTENDKQPVENSQERKPNEHVGFAFSGGITITDPESGQVLLVKRTE